jgi:murein DD-endopeptidase MepM/ murein hydrolase activator NlpD
LKKLIFTISIICTAIVLYCQPITSGGGGYSIPKTECLTKEQYESIKTQLTKSTQELQQKGILPQTFSTEALSFDFPLKQNPAYNYNSYYGISNYFDHNASFPNLITDYNCGTRSYDTQTGYNHQGIDYFLWPFDNLMMSRNQVHIVAAEAGTILFKSDGNADQNCAFCSGCFWNAVYLTHADGSVTWYGHMKTGTLTTKAVGETVTKGEYLGVVGSSGNSTGPHLHFEVYKATPVNNSNLIDPYAGTCNTRNTQSWWASQRPYNQPTINHIQTQTAATSFNTCPALETTNESNQFVAGSTAYFTAYYADQTTGSIATYTITRPDNSVFQTWNQNFTNTFSASWWFFTYIIPTAGPAGTWNFRVVYNGQTVNYPFTVNVATSVRSSLNENIGFKFYPNPVNNELNISTEQFIKQPQIIITNMQGQKVFEQKFDQTSNKFFIRLPFLPKGNYTLLLIDGSTIVAQRKFIK